MNKLFKNTLLALAVALISGGQAFLGVEDAKKVARAVLSAQASPSASKAKQALKVHGPAFAKAKKEYPVEVLAIASEFKPSANTDRAKRLKASVAGITATRTQRAAASLRQAKASVVAAPATAKAASQKAIASSKAAFAKAAPQAKKVALHKGTQVALGATAVAGLGIAFGDKAVEGAKFVANKVTKRQAKELVPTAHSVKAVKAKLAEKLSKFKKPSLNKTTLRRIGGLTLTGLTTAGLVTSLVYRHKEDKKAKAVVKAAAVKGKKARK